MSFITCCPSCGTKFRVVADQLRISEGWVRCGRCQEVFDASQALEASESVQRGQAAAPVAPQPMPQQPVPPTPPEMASPPEVREGALPPAPMPMAASAQPASVPAVASFSGYELPAPPQTDASEPSWLDQALDIAPASPSRDAVTLAQEPALDPEPQEATQPSALLPLGDGPPLTDPVEIAQSAPLEHPERVAPDVPGGLPDTEEPKLSPEEGDAAEVGSVDHVPSFVKQAQRKAWWSQPVVRFVMGMLVILLPLALLLQIAIHERNTLAAWKPQWRPALETLCLAMRCELAPRRDIAAVVLSGSSFAQDVRPHHYRLDISIQNQSSLAVATPAVELTLTDAQDQVLVRKVLNLRDIGAPVELAGRSEWNGILPVKTEGLNLPVSGYRVMAFYP